MALKDETKLRERREEKRKLLSTSAEFRSNECKMHFLIKTNKKKNSATCLLIKTFQAKSMKILNKQI